MTEPPGLANSRLPHGQAWAGWLRERGELTVSPSRGEHTWTSLSCRPQVPWPNSTGASGPGSPQTSAPTAASSREQAGLGGGVRGAPDPAPSLGPELSFRTLPHLPLLPRQAPLATRARPSPSIRMTLTRHTRSAQGLRQKAEPPPSSAHPRAHVKGTLFLLPVTSVFLQQAHTVYSRFFYSRQQPPAKKMKTWLSPPPPTRTHTHLHTCIAARRFLVKSVFSMSVNTATTQLRRALWLQ